MPAWKNFSHLRGRDVLLGEKPLSLGLGEVEQADADIAGGLDHAALAVLRLDVNDDGVMAGSVVRVQPAGVPPDVDRLGEEGIFRQVDAAAAKVPDLVLEPAVLLGEILDAQVGLAGLLEGVVALDAEGRRRANCPTARRRRGEEGGEPQGRR